MYVTDPRGGGVLKYNSVGNLLQKISTTSKNVLGVAVAKNGDILVSQMVEVAVYSPAGSYKNSFGTFGTADGIAVDDAGSVFVVDSKNNNVQIFNSDYSFKSTFGTVGSAAGQFKQPTGITFEKTSGQLAVVDTHNGRVQFFSKAGVYQKTVGSFGAGPLKFTSPQAIAFEYSQDGTVLNRMYVVDSFQANVQVIDAVSASFLGYIGSYGTHEGQMVTPGDILFDPFNRLIIPNGSGSLVVIALEESSQNNSVPGAATTYTTNSSSGTPPLITLNTLPVATNTAAVALSGTVAGGATVSVNGAPATISGSNWNLLVTLAQPGLNNILVTSGNGQNTSSISAYITLDTVVPVVTASSIPLTGSITNTPIQTISGSISDSSATGVTVTVNGVPQNVPINDGLFNTAIILGSGSNNVTITTTDAAGNLSLPVSSTVTYNPLAPAVRVTTPSGAVSGNASYTVTGTAPLNSQVTVNGVPASMTDTDKAAASGVGWASDTRWTATIPLLPGINPITITAGIVGNPVPTTISSSVTYAPGQPSLEVTSPAVDSATALASPVISGTASKGSAVTASLDGVMVPVTVASDGSFSVSLPSFPAPGTYAVAITATDAAGTISSTTRSLVYDPTPPSLVADALNPAAIKVSTVGGVVIAKDKNGAIITPNGSNGTSALDLSGSTYDKASLNIQALTPAGISSRDGDINWDGKVDIADALMSLKVLVGIEPQPSFLQMLHGDVGPLVNGEPTVDSRMRMSDVVVILEKIIGVSAW
jgi:hypothetical protein